MNQNKLSEAYMPLKNEVTGIEKILFFSLYFFCFFRVWYFKITSIFCFFPFVTPYNFIGSDMQPFALLISIVYLIYRQELFITSNDSMKQHLLVYIALIITIISLFFSNETFYIIRCLYNYLSLAIIPLATIICLKIV